MSETVAAARRNVRLLTDDMDPNNYAIDSERLTTLLESRMHLIASKARLGKTWSQNMITLIAGTYDGYTLTAGTQYAQVVALQTNLFKWLLERVTVLELQAMRDSMSNVTGDPTHYALFEDTSQLVNVWFYPTPSRTDTVNVLRSAVPTALTTDAIAIPFSDPLLRALEMDVAISALGLMDEESREARKASTDNVTQWRQDIRGAIKDERVRVGNLRRSDTIPQRWV